jgi:hypothetical protein
MKFLHHYHVHSRDLTPVRLTFENNTNNFISFRKLKLQTTTTNIKLLIFCIIIVHVKYQTLTALKTKASKTLKQRIFISFTNT